MPPCCPCRAVAPSIAGVTVIPYNVDPISRMVRLQASLGACDNYPWPNATWSPGGPGSTPVKRAMARALNYM